MNVINLDPPAPEDALVRLTNRFGCDEWNVGGKSYRPDHRGAFHVPRRHVDWASLHIGGFVKSPITVEESIQDIASHVHLMAPSVAKTKLSQALADLCEVVDAPDA